jgi:glucose dehydrogenase
VAGAGGGSLLWEDRFDLSGGFDSAGDVAVQGRRLFVVGGGQMPSKDGIEDFDWIVRAYDRVSGALLWQDQVDGGLDILDAARAVAVQGRSLVAVGSAGGDGDGDYWVRAYNANTGRLRWEDRIVDPTGTEGATDVVIQGRQAFVVGNRLKVYDLKRGAVVWEDPEVAGQAIAVSGKSVFIAGSRNGDFFVRSYDSRTGVLQWEDLSDLSGGQDTARAVAVYGDGVIAVGSAGDARDFVVRSYEARTGALQWEDRVDTGGLDEALALAIKNRSAYVVGRVAASGTSDFVVRAYNRKTGTLRWDDIFDFGGNDIARTVTVADGQVFVGGSLQEAGFGDSAIVVRAYGATTGHLAWMDTLLEPQASSIEAITALGGRVYAVGTQSLDFLVRAYKAR